MRRREPGRPGAELLFLLSLGGAVLVILLGDTYLLHRVDEYFGGTKVMRPFALTRPWEYALFFFESLLYSLCFYGTVGTLLLITARRLLKLNSIQAIYLSLLLLLCTVVSYWLVSWQVYTYLKTNFDVGVLRQLTVGRFSHFLFYITPEQFLGVALVLLLLMINVAVVRWLRRFDGLLASWAPGRSFWVVVACSWLVLVLNHFAILPQESLRYGLSRQIAYWVTDLGLRQATDFDRDGFGPLSMPRDPDNFDSKVHSHAVDYPGNGLDENGLFGDLDVDEEAERRPAIPALDLAGDPRKNVIVIVVETFRTDVIDMVLDGEPVTPFLDTVARDHAYTEFLYSNYGITSFSIQTTFFGSLFYHRRHRHLFQILREQGYLTYIVSAQNENWGETYDVLDMKSADRFFDARFFDDWDDRDLSPTQKMHPIMATVGSEDLNDRIFETLDEPRDKPFLLYVNYQDLHYPYFHHGMQRKFIDEPRTDTAFFKPANRPAVLRQYANAAHHLDQAIADLFGGLRDRGLLESSIVVILGDHPDSIYENDLLGHAWTVDQHQRKTPLFVVNGKGEFSSPLGQDEIASIIVQSLSSNGATPPLRFIEAPGKRVFVLTGWLGEPRQIAWIAPDELVTYDFKTNRARFGEKGPWLTLREAENHGRAAQVKELVAFWELNHWLYAERAERWQ